MLLTDLDPVTLWCQAERYLGGGTRTYSPFSADLEISDEFHPQRGASQFTLPTFWVPDHHGTWLRNPIPSRLPDDYRDGDRMLLPVHPEALRMPDLYAADALREPGPPLLVVPTANARTVLVRQRGERPVDPHFVKLHYPKRLSRFTRRLRRPVIELQLWVADELYGVAAPFLPEVAGGVVGHDPEHAWGFLLREATVRPGPGLRYTVPLFALYGYDVKAPDEPTLLEQLIRRSGEDAYGWVTRRLIEPLIAMWCVVLRQTGCALEPHGQNALIQFGPDGTEVRVAYRDCAVYVDPALRAERGLHRPLPPRNVISHDIDKPREQVLSLVYDSFLGSHALNYVARLVSERFGVDPDSLHRFARKVFATHAGPEPLLPPSVYYYDQRLHPDGQWQLVDTGASPQWR